MLPTVSTGSEEDGSESPAATPLVPVVAFVGWGLGVCWGSCVDFVHEAQAHATHSTNTVVLSVSHAFIDISDALPFDHAVSFERVSSLNPEKETAGTTAKRWPRRLSSEGLKSSARDDHVADVSTRGCSLAAQSFQHFVMKPQSVEAPCMLLPWITFDRTRRI